MQNDDKRDTGEYKAQFVDALNKVFADYGMVMSTCPNGCGMALGSAADYPYTKLVLMEDDYHVVLQVVH